MFGKTYTAETPGEKVRIDPYFDKNLRVFIQESAQLIRESDPTIPRAELLTDFVHSRIRYAELEDEYNGPGILLNQIYKVRRNPSLGEFIEARAGTCREIGLVLHTVLAVCGKDNEFVTGNREGEPVGEQKHAWVEYPDTRSGVVMVADATENFVMPRDEAYRLRYGGVSDVKRFKFV